MLLHVETKEVLHLWAGNQRLEIVKKLESFLIADITEGVVRVVATENWVEARVGIVKTEALHVLPHGGVSEESGHLAEVLTVDLATDVPFDEDGETFVEPEVFPVFTGDFVAGPGVSHLVSSHVDLRLVADDNRGRSESQERVLHATHGERRRQNNDGVVAPDVGSHVRLNGVKKGTHVLKLIRNLVHLGGLSDDADSSTERTILEVANSDGNQVGGDRNGAAEASSAVVVMGHNTGLVGAHLDHKLGGGGDISAVGDPVGRGVLEGSHRAAVDVLTLSEHVG